VARALDLETYLEISIEMLRETDQDLFAGDNSSVSPDADVADSIVWDGVEVGAGAGVIGVFWPTT
jgi:hypothetical protein